MKKIAIIIGITVLVLVLAAVAIPIFFKPQIKARVNTEIEKNINAKAYYGDLDVSIFKNFPQITLSLYDFGLHGNAPFEGDTLLHSKAFHSSFDISALWTKEAFSVKSIAFDQPKLRLIVLKNGETNYDIFPENNKTTKTKSNFDFKAKLENWEINDGTFVYDNRLDDVLVNLQGLNHNGEGKISSSEFELISDTNIEKAMVNSAGASYLNNRQISFSGPLHINVPKGSYQVSDGNLKINDLPLTVAGSIQKPDSNLILDLNFSSAEKEDFKKLISLIPAMYTNEYTKAKSDGYFNLKGSIKGIYNAVSWPGFDISAKVINGSMQYPNLALPLSKVNIDGRFINTKDQLKYTEIQLPKFSMMMGNNPITGYLKTKGLENTSVDAGLVAKVNLADVNKVFPIDGLVLKGMLNANMKANGWYSDKYFPKIKGDLKLQNGYVKSNKFPEPLENIEVLASILNSNGDASNTKITLQNARLVMQNEPFDIRGSIENLSNAAWDLAIKGKLDLGKITAIYPLDGMKIEGKLDADMTTKGTMQAIHNANYAAINAKGKASLSNFVYKDAAFEQQFKATTASLNFTPKSIIINAAEGSLGQSDYTGSGELENYFGYVFDNQNIRGNFTINSKKFNLNEWMEGDTEAAKQQLTADNIKAVEIPKNIDVVINATVAQSAYEKMPLNNAAGIITIKNGVASLQKVNFNALGGSFVTNGTYNSQDIAHPKFDFDLDLQQIEIPQAYQHLWVVRTLMPLAEYLLGQVTSKIRMGGELGQDMVPKIMSLSGQGLIKLIKAQVRENGFIKEVADKSQLPVLRNMVLKDLLMQAEVKDGRMGFKPFSFALKDHKFTVGGYNALDGTLDWNIGVDAPTGEVGKGFDALFKTWTGRTLPGTDRVAFELKMGGTFKQPKLVFVASKTANNIKDALTAEAKAQMEAAKAKAQAELDKLKNEAEAKKKELEDKARAEVERLKAEAEAKKKELEAAARAEAERIKREAEEKIRAEAERIKKEAEDKAKAELDKLKKEAEAKLAEERARLEKLAKAKLDSAQRANAERIRKALEDKAKAAAEEKRKAAEAKAREAEEKAKAEIEAKRKAAEEEIKKVVEKDSTKGN